MQPKNHKPLSLRSIRALLILFVGVSFLCAVVTPSGTTEKGGESRQDDPELTSLVKQLHALRPEWPYALEAVTLLVRLEQETRTRRVADVRIIYTLFALRDLTDADFVEVAHSHEPEGRVAIFHLPGSESEKPIQPHEWDVLVGAKRGERRTFVTSARFVYTAPFNTGPEGEHGFPPSPGPDEYRAYYKNDEDIIGQLTIMVESDSLAFQEVRSGDAYIKSLANAKDRTDTTPKRHEYQVEGHAHVVFVQQWRDVRPGFDAGLRVHW